MIEHEYRFRVTYAETDKMGIVHHSNYVKYYEVARWELFRSLGVSYHSIEEAGYMVPVINMNLRFIKTAHYDDLLTVRTRLKAIRGARMWVTYLLYNEQLELINEAETELAFVRSDSWKPCGTPSFVKEVIERCSRTEQEYA
ncbi:MAG TPA: thioesterase family protein [Chitinophagaceae bacterium]